MIGKAIGKAVLKDVAKNEANKATGGLAGQKSLIGSANNLKSGLGGMRQTHQAQRLGQGIKPMNKRAEKASFRDNLAQGVARGLASTAVAGVALAGIAGASRLHSKMETEAVWNKLRKENPQLASTSQDRENFEVLQKFSPDIASNITTARSYMQRMKHTNMTPHEFVKDLANIQNVRNKDYTGRMLMDVASRTRGDYPR